MEGNTFHTELYKYSKYHNNHVNKSIHLFCVPLSIFTLYLMLPDVAYALSSLCMLYYVTLDVQIGLIASAVYSTMYFVSYLVRGILPTSYVILVHISCWALQILGHRVFEKNKPAFLQNPLQAVVLAPLFVVYELLIDFEII